MILVNAKTNLDGISVSKFNSAHRQLAEQVREKIRAGHFQPGVQLPTATELAATWKVSTFTVHQALTLLVESGLLIRRRGVGTFVASPQKKLKTVMLYYGRNFLEAGAAAAVYGKLNQLLIEKLDRKKLKNRIVIDSRAASNQTDLPESVIQAIDSRDVQAIIVPLPTMADLPLLKKLPVPTAFMTNLKIENRVYFDFHQFFDVALDQFIQNGGRELGLIAALNSNAEDAAHEPFLRTLLELAVQKQIAIKNEWIRVPKEVLDHEEMELFGKKAFAHMWSLKKRPQGLIVYPDALVRGVIWSLVEQNVQIPNDLQLIFHRNEGMRLTCPYSATWLTTDVDAIADNLIQMVESQAKDEPISTVWMPFKISKEKGFK